MTVEKLTSEQLDRAAEMLRSGKLVAFPTDTFFALGAILTNEAVSELFRVKGRMEGNPVPVLLSSADQVSDVASEFSPEARALAEAFWPGPLTLVLPARDDVPQVVTAGTGNVGVRVPHHELAVRLIAATGRPLTGTSANISGNSPCKTAEEVMDQIGDTISGIVDAACGDHHRPSTVVSFAGGNIQVLRAGAISEGLLEEVLGRPI